MCYIHEQDAQCLISITLDYTACAAAEQITLRSTEQTQLLCWTGNVVV